MDIKSKNNLIRLIIACDRKFKREFPHMKKMERVDAMIEYLIINGVIIPSTRSISSENLEKVLKEIQNNGGS